MALEIFRLVGSVFVDTDEANKSLQKTDENAQGFGKTLLNGITTAAKWAAGLTAAAGAVATVAVKSYAEYEQLVGGIETLFKDSADIVIKNAEAAYKTAGINASEYMDAVTSFTASLLQSLGGDTVAAAAYADMAVTDMADNANKMGTAMESIIQTYQSLARGNYGMLDNLKLGYGGTKAEMERLLADADAINAKQGVITQYSLDNLSDIYEAIHVVQGELGIAGATALEATSTIEGGIKMIKAKLSDLFTKIGGAFAPVAQHLITLVIDNLPRIEAMVEQFLPVAAAGADNLVSLIDKMIDGFVQLIQWVSENGDKIVEWTGYVVAATAGVSAFLIYMNWGQIMSKASAGLTLVSTAIKKMNTAIKSNPIGLLISLITSLIAYLGYLYATNEEFREFVNEMLAELWEKLKVVFEWIEANVMPTIRQIVDEVKAYLIPIIQQLISWAQANLLPAIQSVIAWLRENIPPVVAMIIEWVQTKLIPALQIMVAWAQENIIPIIQKIAEWISGTLIPAIGTIITWVKDHLLPVIVDVFSWITETIGKFFSWISTTIGTFFSWFVGIFQSTSDSTGGIWEACLPFFEGIWNGIILPVWGVYEEMIGAFKMAWDVIKLVWDYVEPYFTAMWENIKATVAILWEFLSMGFKNLWEGIKLTAGILWEYLILGFKTAWETIKLVWEVVVGYFKIVWEGIKGVFSVVVAVLGGFFKTAWEVIKAVWDVAISFFTMVWAGIKAVFAVVKGVLSGDFSDAWEAIKNLWSKAKDFFNSIWTGIKNVFSSTGSWFGNTFKAAWNAVKNVFSATGSWFKSTFQAAWNAVKNVFSSWGSFFSGLWDKIKNTFSKIGTNISNAIGSAVKAGLNGVISSIEGIINSGVNMINGAINLINDIPGVNIGKISKLSLPRLARGGVVDEPTVAQIGEDGAEAVIPLERNTGWIDRLAGKVALSTREQSQDAVSEHSVDAILSKMDELLDALQANQTIALNKREFARIVKEVG